MLRVKDFEGRYFKMADNQAERGFCDKSAKSFARPFAKHANTTGNEAGSGTLLVERPE